MTPHQTPDGQPLPRELIIGTRIVINEEVAKEKNKRDWRTAMHNGEWEVTNVAVKQRGDDVEAKTYVSLRSINRWEGLAFITIPYDPQIMEIQPDKNAPEVEPMFPAAGSKVYIRESDDPAQPGFQDGLWQVEKSSMKKAVGELDETLHLLLKSCQRKNPTYMNVAFNTATMRPVMPAYIEQGGKPAVEVKQAVKVMKPISFKNQS